MSDEYLKRKIKQHDRNMQMVQNMKQAASELPAPSGSARAWQCNLGNGQWDHDWQEKHDDSGGVDGGPSDRWSWRECRVCGEIEAPNAEVSHSRREKTL